MNNIKKKLVLVRHGESLWNIKNKFTGWIDIDLSKKGFIQAKECGKLIKKNNINFIISYSSYLKRSINTLNNILNELDHQWIKTIKTWRLNERHYGLLQGMNREYANKIYGKDKVKLWRRSLKEVPPKIVIDNNEYYNNREFKYINLLKEEYPNSESLEMTINRIKKIWYNSILFYLFKGNVLIVAHGNSIRSIIQIINNFNKNEIESIEIPTGIPYIYEFNNKLEIINNYCL